MKQIFIVLVFFLLFGAILYCKSTPRVKTISHIDFICVEKEKRLLKIYNLGQLIKTYNIALGFSPQGHKRQEGDGKTPEGVYVISHKNPQSQFYLSLKISYPNESDRKYAQANNFSPGGDIMIHGLGKAFSWLGKLHRNKDWTLGCIALTNEEIKEIYNATSIGTKIEIRP